MELASPLRRGVARTWLRSRSTPSGDVVAMVTTMNEAMGAEHAVLFRARSLHAPPEFFTEATQAAALLALAPEEGTPSLCRLLCAGAQLCGWCRGGRRAGLRRQVIDV